MMRKSDGGRGSGKSVAGDGGEKSDAGKSELDVDEDFAEADEHICTLVNKVSRIGGEVGGAVGKELKSAAKRTYEVFDAVRTNVGSKVEKMMDRMEARKAKELEALRRQLEVARNDLELLRKMNVDKERSMVDEMKKEIAEMLVKDKMDRDELKKEVRDMVGKVVEEVKGSNDSNLVVGREVCYAGIACGKSGGPGKVTGSKKVRKEGDVGEMEIVRVRSGKDVGEVMGEIKKVDPGAHG